MNAFYVIVSIPLLLILAGFNHAHGLTTFGKSTNTGTQNTPQQPPVQGKSCTIQANCTFVKGTTCIRGYCLCGDNGHPVNGKCSAELKAPRHICSTDEECIENADCLVPKNKTKPLPTGLEKICTCQEGFYESAGGTCGGLSNFHIYPGVILVVTMFVSLMN